VYVDLRNVCIPGLCVEVELLGLDEDESDFSLFALVRCELVRCDGRVSQGYGPLAVIPLLEQLQHQLCRVNGN